MRGRSAGDAGADSGNEGATGLVTKGSTRDFVKEYRNLRVTPTRGAEFRTTRAVARSTAAPRGIRVMPSARSAYGSKSASGC